MILFFVSFYWSTIFLVREMLEIKLWSFLSNWESLSLGKIGSFFKENSIKFKGFGGLIYIFSVLYVWSKDVDGPSFVAFKVFLKEWTVFLGSIASAKSDLQSTIDVCIIYFFSLVYVIALTLLIGELRRELI